MSEVGGRDEPKGDALKHPELGVSAFQAAVGDPVGIVKGEDLVSPVDERSYDLLEFGQGPVGVGGDELTEGLVGLLLSLGQIDAVQVLVEDPGVGKLGMGPQDLLEPAAGFLIEPVFPAQDQVAGSEHLRVEGGPGTLVADPLDPPPHLDQSRGEPAGDVGPREWLHPGVV